MADRHPSGRPHRRAASRGGRAAVRVLGAVVVGGVLVSCGADQGTVVAKAHQLPDDGACRASAIVTAPVTVPVSEICSVPECWRLSIRDNDGNTFDACVSREEYDRSRPGDFWHERTD